MTDQHHDARAAKHVNSGADDDLVIDQICRDYEDSWNDGSRPSLQEIISSVEDSIRTRVLSELVAIEVERRLLAGETPSLDEYVTQFPNDSATVINAFQESESQSNRPTFAGSTNGPQVIGGFRIVREIGRGGMGIVYEAVEESLGRRVALKTLLHGIDSREEVRNRFEREARAIARLHHTNIVDVFGNGDHDGNPYFAMRLINGSSLSETIAVTARATCDQNFEPGETVSISPESGISGVGSEPATDAEPLPRIKVKHGIATPRSTGDCLSLRQIDHRARTAARIGSLLASALQYAHECGVIHRDVKPSNILIDQTGTPWLTDFGLARMTESQSAAGLTDDGALLGTLRYLPPEAFGGQVNKEGDQYSLGLSLYELIALRPAFERGDAAGLIDEVKHSQPPLLETLQPNAPRDLVTIIHKAIDRDPAARYATAGHLADDLNRFLNDEPIAARRVSSLERLSRWSRRNRALAVTMSSMALLLLVVAVSSTIVAGYFQSLNDTLENTVGDLTTTTNDLTEARNTAQQSAVENLQLAQNAERARARAVESEQSAQTTLADMQTERGLLAAEDGAPAEAMLWFATAAAQTPHDPARQAANRLRARNWMNETVLPVASMSFQTPGYQSRLLFQPRDKKAPRPADAPNSRPLLLTVGSGELFLWQMDSQSSLPWANPLADVTDACWMPDGEHVLIGMKSGEIQIREVPGGAVTRSMRRTEPAHAVACSHDGSRVASSGDTVLVWNVSTEEPVLEHSWPHPAFVHSVAFGRSTPVLATACRDNLTRVFAVGGDAERSGSPLFEPALQNSSYAEITPVFVEDDRVLVTTANSWRLGWVDSSTGNDDRPERDRIHHRIDRLVGDDAGQRIVACAGDNCELRSIGGDQKSFSHPHIVRDVAISPDGSMLLTSCHDWNSRLWSLTDNTPSPIVFPQMDVPNRCAWSPDARYCAVTDNEHVRIWKRPQSSTLRLNGPGWLNTAGRPRPSADGRRVTIGRWHENPNHSLLNNPAILNTDDGSPAGPELPKTGIVDTCLGPDGQWVAVISTANFPNVAVYKVETATLIWKSDRLPANPVSVAASPTSSELAVFCQDGSLHQFAAGDGKPMWVIQDDNWKWRENYYSFHARTRYSPDGTSLVLLTPDSEIVVLDARNHEPRFPPIRPLRNGGLCRALAISSDSRFLATGVTGEHAAQVWDLSTGQPLGEVMPHSGGVYGIFSIRFSPDSRLLLTTNKDGRARLWDWRTGQLACPPMEHPDEVNDADFASDGGYAITLARDDRIRAWELSTGKLIASSLAIASQTKAPNFGIGALAVIRNRAVMVARSNPIIDLSNWLSVPELSIESLRTLAELATARRILVGETDAMVTADWEQLWQAPETRANLKDVFTRTGSPVFDPYNPAEFERHTERLRRAWEAAPDDRSRCIELAEYLARIGRWGASAAAHQRFLERHWEDKHAWGPVAARLLMEGDMDGYKAHCETLKKLFLDFDSHWARYILCYQTQLYPGVVDVADLPIGRMRQDDTYLLNGPEPYNAWLVMLSYREGKFEDVIRDAAPLSQSKRNDIKGLVLSVRAMAEHRLGQTEAARKTLAEAATSIPPVLRTFGTPEHQGPPTISAANCANIILAAELLRREAAGLLEASE